MLLRILIVSNAPWAGSGFGTQAAQVGKQLRKAGHQVAFFANWGLGGSKTVWEGFQVYPAGLAQNGDDMIHGHADHWQADVVLILFDAFALDGRIHRMMKQLVMMWQPVDCDPMSQADLMQFRISGDQPVAMSKFGARKMAAEGLDPFYAPHGIDTRDVFLPAEQIVNNANGRPELGPPSRQYAMQALREDNSLPQDAFLIGMNVHNKDTSRKAVFEQMSAFALLRRKHSDALLMCHSMPHPAMSGNDLLSMAEFLGIADHVRWADPYSLLAGDYTQGDMAKWYAQLDVYSGAARAEGFGLPLIESQACGTPVITTDASSMTELVGPGWLVEGQPTWNPGHRSVWITPDIGSLAMAYESAYVGNLEKRSSEARDFAVVHYDQDIVFDQYWTEIWGTVERGLAEQPPREDREGWRLVK